MPFFISRDQGAEPRSRWPWYQVPTPGFSSAAGLGGAPWSHRRPLGLAWPGLGVDRIPSRLHLSPLEGCQPGRKCPPASEPVQRQGPCVYTRRASAPTPDNALPPRPSPPSLLHCALGEPGEDRRVPPSPSPPSQRLFKVLFPHMWKCPWSHLFVPPFLAPSLPFFLVLPGHGVCHPTVEPPCAKGPPRWRGQREDRRAGVPPRAGGGGHTQIGARRQRLCGYSCI